ncbi:MAG: sulfatase-like hydrolase/transferase [Rikenellaceae bacterium]
MKNLLLTAGAVGVTVSAMAQTKQPNIVLILADDMRGSAINFLGHEDVKTPNLDQFSQDATTFTNAYIMGGTSGAVSMPSRAMLMSGKYLHTLVKQGGTIPAEHATIGQTLQQNGYTTFHTGKWHNGTDAFNRCFNDGKAIYFGGMADHWNVPLCDYHESGVYKNNRPVITSPMSSNEVKYEKGDYILSGFHSVDIFTDVAIDYIEDYDATNEKPFFLSVSYMSPHDPRSTHQEYFDMYADDDMKLPESFCPEHPFDNGELRIRDEKLIPFPRTEEDVKSQIADYYAMISHMDAGTGKIIETLKEKGLYENTIIIFAADNGLAVGQHGLVGKQNMYEHSIKVPLMIKEANSSSKGATRDEHCLLIDIFPTLCDYLGVTVPETVDGVSLKPIIAKNQSTRDYLYHGYVQKQRAVSDGEWKLIEYFVNDVRTTQLFNIVKDPKELNDLWERRSMQRRSLNYASR